MSLDREDYFFTPRYTRGKVCKALGVTKETLRHYENCGLLKPKEDNKNKYKYYSIADLEILNVILFLRAMDVPTKDIPKFIECKNIDTYGSFLDDHIGLVVDKINHWNHIKEVLTYLKDTLEYYKNAPQKVAIVENIVFRFRIAKFDYNSHDLEEMTPSNVSKNTTSHIIQLKIIDKNWVLSNRKDASEMLVGHLCSQDEEEGNIHTCAIDKSLLINTLETLEEIPKIIQNAWNNYRNDYEFSDKAYIVEHTFFNIFNQEALLRNIYLPIVKLK